MAAYKDEQRGTWYVSFHYYDWTGKNCRKVKKGFKIKREATEWEHHFRMKEATDLDIQLHTCGPVCKWRMSNTYSDEFMQKRYVTRKISRNRGYSYPKTLIKVCINTIRGASMMKNKEGQLCL